jgi:hypothetical protein
MAVKVGFWEIGVPIQNIDNDRSPSNDVALLGFFVEDHEAANDIYTKSSIKRQYLAFSLVG